MIFSYFADVGSPTESQVRLNMEELIENDKEVTCGFETNSGKEIDATKQEYTSNYLLRTIFGEPVNYETVTYDGSSVRSAGIINTISDRFPMLNIWNSIHLRPMKMKSTGRRWDLCMRIMVGNGLLWRL